MADKIRVMVSGLPGKMATLVAREVAGWDDMELASVGLSEESREVFNFDPSDPRRIVTLKPVFDVKDTLGWPTVDLIVDFTQPKAVNDNAERYCSWGIPFVMGTTGGDREKLALQVKSSDISAVIATNFSTPVVIFQEMIRWAARTFPGGLRGWTLYRIESHQQGKKDPSGTMIAIKGAFEALTHQPAPDSRIVMIRDPRIQELELGVPSQYLGGHGFHKYILRSPDGLVDLKFEHNVLGRSTYIPLQAIRFLARQKGVKGKVFSMIDVLQAGAQ